MAVPSFLCFGEVLWDMLPGGKVAGGAPMNVAVHLNNLGIEAAMISRVGQDALGKELVSFMKDKGVATHLIQQDPDHPTGTVLVSLDELGQAKYEIAQPVAWDYIAATPEILAAIESSDVLVFGSLAARSPGTRATLSQLLNISARKVFDVNLRPPFYARPVVEELMQAAQIVKMNDEELDEISEWYDFKGQLPEQMLQLMKKYRIDHLLVTRGADGAVYRYPEGIVSHPGYRVTVKDTVGSGDTFLATFLSQWSHGQPPAARLQYACAAGALVASMEGGTPKIDHDMIRQFIEDKEPGALSEKIV